MKYRINDVEINYVNYGNPKGQDVVLLHGWGQNIEMMKPIGDNLDKLYNIYIIDLPGHGLSSEPTYGWQLIDYVEALNRMFRTLKIDKPILVGHSFGGELSLLYASLYEVSKVVVLDSPFRPIVKKLTLKQKMFKTAKKIPLLNKLENFAKKHTGSLEYRNATVIMRQILVNSVNTDITNELKNIKVPVLIIWGDLDDTVPIEEAYELEKQIKDAGVVVYEGCTHYAYLEQLGKTINVLKSFIGG